MSRTSSTTLLIDGDITIYTACSRTMVSVEWEPGQFSVNADADAACRFVDAEIAGLLRTLDADDAIIVLSSEGNTFRKDLCPTYKAGRKPKPPSYAAVRAYVQQTYKTECAPRLEADDVLGMLATGKRIKGRRIIVSADKDLLTVPGHVYNMGHPDRGVVTTSAEEADYRHLIQTLTGDRADNYPGLPGCGPVKAAKILADVAPADRWLAVTDAFASKGLTDKDALLQARLARILRCGEYNKKTAQVKLWNP